MRVDVCVYTCNRYADEADIFKNEEDYIFIEFTEKEKKNETK